MKDRSTKKYYETSIVDGRKKFLGGFEMGNEQFENAMRLAWDAYKANNEEEAKSFFNQALTINPASVEAKVGKACAILISFTLAAAVSDAQQAFSFWEQASKQADFSDQERKNICDSAIGFASGWRNGAEQHFRQFKEVDSAKSEWNQTQKNIAIFLSNITGLSGMSDHVSFLEHSVELTGKMTGMDITGINIEMKKMLFFAKHPFKKSIKLAEEVLPNRSDFDGNPKFGFGLMSTKKYEFKSKIDVVKGKLKINDVRLNFFADEESISLEVTYEGSIRVEDPAKVESLAKEKCKLWTIGSDKKSVTMSIVKKYLDKEVEPVLPEIQKQVDEIIAEGLTILEIIDSNGGKQGLFASMFGKK